MPPWSSHGWAGRWPWQPSWLNQLLAWRDHWLMAIKVITPSIPVTTPTSSPPATSPITSPAIPTSTYNQSDNCEVDHDPDMKLRRRFHASDSSSLAGRMVFFYSWEDGQPCSCSGSSCCSSMMPFLLAHILLCFDLKLLRDAWKFLLINRVETLSSVLIVNF